jgi:hypothetical protein
VPSRSKSLSTDQIGDLGELAFERLCTEQGLLPEKFRRDRTGTDYLVKWPIEADSSGQSYDTRPNPRECRVQVKTTSASPLRLRLKLSAAERLAKEHGPAFIVAPVLAGVELAHLTVFHVHGDLLAYLLKAMRIAQKEGELLSRKIVTVPTRLGHRLSGLNDLRMFFETAIGSNPLSYINAKAEELASAGYADERGTTIPITFDTDNPADVVALMLGEKQLLVDIGTPVDTRFDIPLPAANLARLQGKALLSASPTADRWKVIALNAGGETIAVIDGEATSAALPGYGPEYWRSKFSNGLISLSIGEGKISVSTGGPEMFAGRHRLSTIRASVHLWRALAIEGATLAIQRADRLTPFSPLPTTEDRDRHDQWTNQVLTIIDRAIRLFKFCGLPDPEVSVRELWDAAADMATASRKISRRQADESPVKFTAATNAEFDKLLSVSQHPSLLMTMPFIVGGYVLAIAITYAMTIEKHGDQVSAVSHLRSAVAGAHWPNDDDVIATYQRFRDEVRSETGPAFFYELNELLPYDSAQIEPTVASQIR